MVGFGQTELVWLWSESGRDKLGMSSHFLCFQRKANRFALGLKKQIEIV